MHPTHAQFAPPRRPPRRWKSTSTTGSELLDDISEVEVFQPRVPRRNKSTDELEAELLMGTGNDIPDVIDLSQLAQNLHSIRLHEMDMLDNNDDESAEEDDLRLLANDDSDQDEDEQEDAAMSVYSTSRASSNNRSRRGNLSGGCPSNSFCSIGSSMTLAQQKEPGRFVTPASSFMMNEPIGTCQGVERHDRVTVDPYQFMTADMSFRLPLVGSLTDSSLVVKKTVATDMNEDDHLKKATGGRKTIQLDETAIMPTISLGFDSEDELEQAPLQQEQEEEQEPPLRPIMFGMIRRESRRIIRPNIS